ncbi:MAG: hypothetical protein ABSE82_12785 [Nitrososphaerales archaeon]|jgi:hypothetical protein
MYSPTMHCFLKCPTLLRGLASIALEERVNDLAEVVGFEFDEKEKRQFEFRDDRLRECAKKGNLVEVDLVRYRIQRVGGKKKRNYILGECKLRNGKASLSEVKCFQLKVEEFIRREQEKSSGYGGIDKPRIETTWFVSLPGFEFSPNLMNSEKSPIRVELIDNERLNTMLRNNNLPQVII